MSYNATARTPANGASVALGTTTLSVSYNMTGGAFIYMHKIFARKNGGTWSETSRSGTWSGACTFTKSVVMYPGNYAEWYVTVYWIDAGGVYQTTLMASWYFSVAPDTTDPTITSVSPATGNVAPGSAGVVFSATVADDYEIDEAKLYIDGSVEQTWTDGGALARTESLDLGAHTYRWTAADPAGNTADTGTVNITVINAVPVVPSGTITVAGQTGAVEVANLGHIAVSWPAFLDGNPEDSLTYTVDYQIDSGGWIEVDSGIATTSVEWIPDDGLGAAELRVKANDGTGDSSYLSRSSITVLSSQSPTDPVLDEPADTPWREGETHSVTWTESTHPESLPITYEIQFSAAGDFSDAVVITTTATGASYAWTLATTLVASDTATCKIRLRASDGYSKTSNWDTSGAFTVDENAAPTATLVSPVDIATGNTPYLVFAIDDDDSDDVHMEVMLSLSPSFGTAYYLKSVLSQDAWEEAADPYSTWTDLGSGGATAGNRIRVTCPALRFDVYFMKFRAYDGILYSGWSPTVEFRVTPSGVVPLTTTVGEDTYLVSGLRVTERTGGEASPFSFRVPLSILATQPIARGASVSIGLSIGGQSRVWNGTVEALVSSGAEVEVQCVQDDAYLARKLVTGDESSADIGAILAAFVDDYGAPLGSTHMDTTLGVTLAVAGQYKSLLDHLREWAQLLGLILFVDSDGEVHLTDPADVADPTYILSEDYS